MIWRTAAASAVGTSHVASLTPCQDACSAVVLASPIGSPVLVAIASDGAGSARRAEIGSRLVVASFQVLIERWVARGMSLGDLQREDIEQWVRITQEAIAKRAGSDESLDDFAATVVGCAVGDGVTVWWQIGDGAVVFETDSTEPDLVLAHARYRVGCWPQQGEYANETTFVTSLDACTHLECGILPYEAQRLALFTDGLQHLLLRFQDRTVHEPWFDAQFAFISGLNSPPADELNHALTQLISGKRFTDETDDDRTLILACRIPG